MTVTFTSLVNFKNEKLLWNATRDLIHTHPNSYPLVLLRALKHWYRCIIS